MKDITKKYTNGEVTIIWKPALCIHSKLCWKGLESVFKPKERPWITPEGAVTEDIIAQVNKCPSQALSFYMNNEEQPKEQITQSESIIETIPNGPLMVYGNITVKHANGETKKNKVTAFCRCGASNNKPYCDGMHTKINFEG